MKALAVDRGAALPERGPAARGDRELRGRRRACRCRRWALGRFMRDMFGEQSRSRGSTHARDEAQPIDHEGEHDLRRRTASGPVAACRRRHADRRTTTGIPDEDARVPRQLGVAGAHRARPAARTSHEDDRASDRAEWNAKSYPPRGSRRCCGSRRTPPMPRRRAAATRCRCMRAPPTPERPHDAAEGTQPLPPPSRVPAPNPARALGLRRPRSPAECRASRRSSARATATRARRRAAAMSRIRATRRRTTRSRRRAAQAEPPAAVHRRSASRIVGIIVMLAVSFSGGATEQGRRRRADDAGSTRPRRARQMHDAQPSRAPKPAAATPPTRHGDDHDRQSDPTGADVLIAGTKIGTTPLDTKLKRGTQGRSSSRSTWPATDITSKIDLGGDYANEHVKLLKVGEEPERATGSATAEVARPPERDHSGRQKAPRATRQATRRKTEPQGREDDEHTGRPQEGAESMKKERGRVQHDKPATAEVSAARPERRSVQLRPDLPAK